MADNETELHLRVADPADIRIPTIKAHFVGRDGSESSNVGASATAERTLFKSAGAIEPPLDPTELTMLLEMSGSLRTSVDAYATNIDGFGHDFEPTVDFDDPDTYEMVRQAMVENKLDAQLSASSNPKEAAAKLMDKIMSVQRIVTGAPVAKDGSEEGEGDIDYDMASLDIEVTDAEVEAKVDEMRRAMVRELERARTFFDWCCITHSFPKLRVMVRQDVETLGNGYWEVVRNDMGVPVQLTYAPGFTIRLMPQDDSTTQVYVDIPRSLLRVDREIVNHRFRRYVQVNVTSSVTSHSQGGKQVYFKEFGDPRVVSRESGEYYADLKALKSAEPTSHAATELMHFKVHSSRSPYGVPRWISELLAVLGNRNAEEINLAYFENKSIPPMAILVSGGRLAAGEVENIKDFIKNEIRGKRNFHKIMVLQAEPFPNMLTGQNSGSVKIEIKPLTNSQQQDGLFMDYQERNGDRIGQVFRIPRLLRGDTRDFNRATADASLAFAEKQVFAPLRRDFDWNINRFLMPAVGVKLWRFISKGPETTDLGELGTMLNNAADAGYLSIKELRDIAGRVFGRKFGQIEDTEYVDEELAVIPLELLRIGLAGTDSMGLDPGSDDGEDLPDKEEEDTPAQKRVRTQRRRKARAALKLMALEAHFQEVARTQAALRFQDSHDPDANEDQP